MKPLVYISTRGGIADTTVLSGDVNTLEIDWDNMKDCDCALEDLVSTIAEVKRYLTKLPGDPYLLEAREELEHLISISVQPLKPLKAR
jgi:hypothetical protein